MLVGFVGSIVLHFTVFVFLFQVTFVIINQSLIELLAVANYRYHQGASQKKSDRGQIVLFFFRTRLVPHLFADVGEAEVTVTQRVSQL